MLTATCRAVLLHLLVRGGLGEEDKNTTRPYVAPPTEGLHWAELFDGDVWSRWASSEQEKYDGKFAAEARKKEALVGDVGLAVPEEAKHYGVASTFLPIEGQKGVPFIVQFEAKFQDGLSCGGSYIKLYNSEGKTAREFKDDTPYVIMFGPDRCGGTDKVHFILQHRNPKSGKWEEKHFKEPPSVPHDQKTHLYRLVVNADNSFDVEIDGEKKTSGSLLTSMEPPVNPPKEIDDPADKKPGDWIDEPKMDDPAASKPDDWDEDAPMQIPDPKATMPSGWKEDAEKQIPDPNAKIPDDWDTEEDGDWEAPIIDNPECKVGCGKWEPPSISNPAYKGKWYAPKIDNPAYIGVWKPNQIANPDYFVDESPGLLPKIDAVGIDIWTMSKGLLFDNIVVATDLAKAKAFADASFGQRRELESLQDPAQSSKGGVMEFLAKNYVAVLVTGALALLTLFIFFFMGTRAAPKKSKKAEKKKAEDAPKKDEGEKAEEKEEEEKKEEKEEEKKEDKDSAQKEEEPKPKESKPEGGLGNIGEDDE